jgi:hypothetical protein
MDLDWESWDWDTVHREIASLPLSDVIGLDETDVRGRFGEPDDVVIPGSEETDASGNLLFQADSDLRYYRLLPHTCLNISVSRGRAAKMSLWPKWKRCPSASIQVLGPIYAPA